MAKGSGGKASGSMDEMTKELSKFSGRITKSKEGHEHAEPRKEEPPLCLVTGAGGRLGRYLVEAMLSIGWRVRVLHREFESQQQYPEGVQIVYGDLTKKASLEPAVQDVDYIYHLAALVSHSAPINDLLEVNYRGTQNLIDVSRTRAYTLKRFIYVSTISVYGKSMERLPADEETPLNPSDGYARSKRMAEGVVMQYSDKMPVVILRPAVIYGKSFDEAYLPVLAALERGKMPIIGSGDNTIPFIHATDVVRALLLAATSDRAQGNIYVIAPRERRTQREILELASKHLGVNPPRRRMPLWRVKLGLKIGRLLSIITRKRPKLLEEHLDTMAADRYFDTSKAEKELGFKPIVKLDDGMKEMVEYYKAGIGGAR